MEHSISDSMSSDSLEKYTAILINKGAADVKVISPQTVVTAPWVVFKCQFGCTHYNKGLCCPPYTPKYDETRKILDSFEKAIIFHTHDRRNTTRIAEETAKEIFFDGYYKVIPLGSGPCTLCKECNINDVCRNPGKAVPSMESCGIDVFETARRSGFNINTLKSRDEETDNFGLILVF